MGDDPRKKYEVGDDGVEGKDRVVGDGKTAPIPLTSTTDVSKHPGS